MTRHFRFGEVFVTEDGRFLGAQLRTVVSTIPADEVEDYLDQNAAIAVVQQGG